MDDVLQKQFPTVLALRFALHEPMVGDGERFVLTRDRVLFEVRRPWLHAVQPISEPLLRATPYGDGPKHGIELLCGPVPQHMLDRFIAQSRSAFPNETAAWIVWHELEKRFVYQTLTITSSSNSHVTFQRPTLPSGWHLVLDIHSHGAFDAFFSSQDDKDDKDQLCISAVVGHANDQHPVVIARLSMLGVFCPLGNF